MASGNSTTADNNSTQTGQKTSNNSVGTATYYGAIVIAVFLLIALAIIVRIVYSRKYKQRNPAIDEPTLDSREREERLAMERRGEEVGLPTYRESILLPNNDTVLAATPMSDEAYRQRPSTAETLPNQGATTQITVLEVFPPDDENVQPPKYEVDLTDADPNSITLPSANQEMRMSSQSATTLVLPSVSISQPDEDPPPPNSNQADQQPSTPPPLSPSDSNTQINT